MEADTLTHGVEGNIDAGKSKAARPEWFNRTRRLRRGHRTQHVCKGLPGTWEAPSSPPKGGTASEGNEATGTDDEVTEHLVVPTKQENRLAGSCGGKGMPENGTAGGKDDGDAEL